MSVHPTPRGLLPWVATGLLACGPKPPEAPTREFAVALQPDPQSAEWLYATPNSSGQRDEECLAVEEVLVAEESCAAGLCRHALALTDDWLALCKPTAGGSIQELRQVFVKRSKETGSACVERGMELTRQGCKEAEGCKAVAQSWATQCGEAASPLVLRIIEQKVSRMVGRRVELDNTACSTLLSMLEKEPQCANDFECKAQVRQLDVYEKRCVKRGVPVPVENALVRGRLLLSAGQRVAPIPVQSERVAPQKERLLLDNGAGFVVRADEVQPKTVAQLRRVMEHSEALTKLTVAGIFAAKQTAFELRFGTLFVPDLATMSRRYPKLLLEGQLESQRLRVANESISELNEAARALNDYDAAMPLVMKSLALVPKEDAEAAAELHKADKHLARLFGRLARAKSDAINNITNATARVAFARRAQDNPFWDVNHRGGVELDATHLAALSSVEELFPKSFAVYRERLSGRLRHLAAAPPERAKEEALKKLARKGIVACRGTLEAIAKLREQLMNCAFSYQACAPSLVDQRAEALDAADAELESRRLALASLLVALARTPEDIRSQAAPCLESQR